METVTLGTGSTGPLTVSALGFGGMALTPAYGGLPAGDALAVLHAAVDDGITFLDTANVYGDGTNEELMGRLLADRRDEVVVATKFGIVHGADGTRHARGDADYVRRCAEESLRRLGTDVIDLYYLHRRDLSVPLSETVGAMASLVEAGTVRHLGLCEVTAEELREAHLVHPITAVQSEWSVFSRDVERAVVPACADLGIGVVPFSPLGRGFLAGAVRSAADLGPDDARHDFPRFDPANLEANLALLAEIEAAAHETGITLAEMSLAWLYAKGEDAGVTVVPIPGSRHPERNRQNAAAVEISLSAEQVAELDSAADRVAGGRSRDRTWVSEGREDG
ncbi:oxidoreductase [Tersicoccus solisilvae]|uniref:Oxidoreductase n=1 Tax=Tersicoccus solisilvae TaxID=1882339 RepID=A0ABQ1NM46_9MICC|nr:aldo/keto reductase [Tersicoccus solisilvae]GGC80507.1 oxidoreductase [Tersicoccus solisilvae]